MRRSFVLLLVLLFCCIFISVDVECRRRSKRESFHVIISNQTLPCVKMAEMLKRENGGRPPRWTQLNDEDKKLLLRMRGYDFIRSLMGTSGRDADLIFDPLLPAQPLTSKTGTRPLLRSEILNHLQNDRELNDTASSSRSSSSSSSSSSDEDSTVAQQLPYVAPEDIGLNRTMLKSSEFVTTVDYCVPRSSAMTQINGVNYLRMCTACATTTTSPPDFWPEYLYGVICHSDDVSCLYEADTAFGRCVATGMSVMMLRKSADLCLLVLENGQKMIAQDWSPTQYQLSIGCECAVSEQSRFR